MPIELYSLEQPGDQSESSRIARVEFLRLIPLVKPECLEELWQLAFMEFVHVVSEMFQSELVQGSEQETANGIKVFSSLLTQTYSRIRNDGLLNKSIGDLLCLTFARYHKIDQIELKKAIPNFEAITKLACAQNLCALITYWSRRWNLDAEWCRNQAVKTLRSLLVSDRLKWSFLDNVKSLDSIWREGTLKAIDDTTNTAGDIAVLIKAIDALKIEESDCMDFAWYWAAQEITDALLWSRVELSLDIHGSAGAPKPFKFKWRDISFVRPGFHVLRESQAQCRRRLEVEFRLLLNERERLVLTKMLASDAKSDYNEDLGYGLLQKFRKRLDQHIKEILKTTSERTKNLVPTKKRRQLDRNLRWTIQYQLDSTKTLAEIAGNIKKISKVQRAIDDSLSLLGLAKRPDAKPGRKLGSRNVYHDPLKN